MPNGGVFAALPVAPLAVFADAATDHVNRRLHKGHQEAHDASLSGECRRRLDRELRALVQDARDELSPEEFKHLRWAVKVALG